MKIIELTQGQITIVDDENYEYLMQWKWYAWFSVCSKSFYAARMTVLNGKRAVIYMHRLIMKVTDRKIQVDHKNHITLNNQQSNLRIATASQNASNSRAKKNGKSKYLGVCWHTQNNKWQAAIVKDRKSEYIGLFKNEIDAAKAYNAKALELHGEFANLNTL
jgi:hypothetical protein